MKRLVDLEELVLEFRSADFSRGQREVCAVAIFDLPGSTALKLERGHYEGTRRALRHNLICKEISKAFGGRVVKELGDGVLITFKDAIDACRASLAIKQALRKVGNLKTKAGITFGHVEHVALNRATDILGDVVDRCARIQALAQPGQILIDRALRDAVRSILKDYAEVWLSESIAVWLKGIGETEVYELSTKRWGFVGAAGIKGMFKVHEEGRLSLPEKVAFIEGADTEVIELGIALTTFADYFVSRKPSEFKQPVKQLVAKGVRFKCLALDPNWNAGKLYALDRREKAYIQEVHQSIKTLRGIRDEFVREKFRGSFEVYLYSHFPYFHAVAVDGRNEKAGRLTVSNYLYGTARAKCPVLQFSRASNPEMFKTYWGSIQRLLAGSKCLR